MQKSTRSLAEGFSRINNRTKRWTSTAIAVTSALLFSSCDVQDSDSFDISEIAPEIKIHQNGIGFEHPVKVKLFVGNRGNGTTLKLGVNERLQGEINDSPFAITEFISGDLLEVYSNNEITPKENDVVDIIYVRDDKAVGTATVAVPPTFANLNVEKGNYSIGDTVGLSWDNAIDFNQEGMVLYHVSGENGFMYDDTVVVGDDDVVSLEPQSMHYVLNEENGGKQSGTLAVRLVFITPGTLTGFHSSGTITAHSSSDVVGVAVNN